MGCVASREHRGRLRRMLPAVNTRFRRKQKKLLLSEQACAESEAEGDGVHLEVIDVGELMQGLEDEAEDEGSCFDFFNAAAGFSAQASGSEQPKQQAPSGADSCLASSSDSCVTPFESPRSPLLFDAGGLPKFAARYRSRRGTTLDSLSTNRNFSFKLKIAATDQAATPKVVLDSNSPLLSKSQNDVPDQVQDQDRPNSVLKGQDIVLYFRSNQWNHEEGCGRVRSVLETYGIVVEERDISAHPDYENLELGLVPAALFINGRCIGNAEQLLELNERGQLGMLLDGGESCKGCGGVGYVPCLDCIGSLKFLSEDGQLEICRNCSRKGMVKCPLCWDL